MFLIIRFMFFSCFVCLPFYLCALFFCIFLCIVSPHVYGYLFSICEQFYRPLPLGGDPIAVKKCRILWCKKLRAPRNEQLF